MALQAAKSKLPTQRTILNAFRTKVEALNVNTATETRMLALRSKIDSNIAAYQRIIDDICACDDEEATADAQVLLVNTLQEYERLSSSMDLIEQQALVHRIKRQLTGIHAKLPAFHNFCRISETVNAERVNVAYETFFPLLNKYEITSDQLLQISTNDDERQGILCQLQEFESDWAITLSLFDMSVVVQSDDKRSDNENSHHQRGHHSTQVKLPKLELPKFNGEPTTWVPFRDTYKALVHDVTSVTNIQKFSYLKASITDKFSPISHLAISEDGYADAWQSVLTFYNNDRRIADAHMQALFSTRVMRQESAEDLTSIINIYSSNIDCIKRIIPENERFESIIAFLALYRLDEHTKELFEAECETKLPLWTSLKTFLEKRRKVLENINLNKPKKSIPVNRPKQGFTSASYSNVATSSTFGGFSGQKCRT